MFIDSIVWIGAKLKRDQWHNKSVPIINKFPNTNKEINIVYITDYIICNFLLRKAGFEGALERLSHNYPTTNRNYTIVQTSKKTLSF